MILLAVDTALDACAAAVAFNRDGAVEVDRKSVV
jgi:tRNA A37 threonylcarbamoyladenosine modification protein TsaB